MASMSLDVPFASPLHGRLCQLLMDRVKMARKRQQDQHEKWRKAEESVLCYVPEEELDAKRRLRREQRGLPSYTTIKIPYTFALLMTAHTYFTSVFLSRAPIHQYAGRHGETEQQVQAIESLVSYQVEAGRMAAPYYLWFYDAAKYGTGILGEYWDQETIQYSSIQSVQAPDGTVQSTQITQQLAGYKGTKVYNVSPYDFYPDPRVPVGEFQRGEFVAVHRDLPWNEVIRRKFQGYYINTEQINGYTGLNAGSTQVSQLERPSFEDAYYPDEAGGSRRRPSMVACWEVHVELIPAEWGLGSSSFPEKWCFTITEDYKIILGACPMGYAHGRFMFNVLEVEVEAYGQWNRGIPEQIEQLQNTMDWLLNSHFWNVRASMNNQFIADPTRLVMKDFERGEPGLFVRLKPEAFGQDVRQFFMQIPVQDVTQNHVNDLQIMLGIGERTTGINDQLMGMLNTTGRKTATEIRTSTGFGVNRLKTLSEYMSATGFSDHSMKLVQCAQQYYDAPMKLRVVGDVAAQDNMSFVNVTPEMIAGNYQFIPIDGTLPVDRMAQANLWKEILVGMRSIPEVGMTYDMAKIFGHVALLGGIRNLNQFKLDPQTAALRGLQQGIQAQVMAPGASPGKNVVPIRPGAPSQSDTRKTGVQAPAPVGGPA